LAHTETPQSLRFRRTRGIPASLIVAMIVSIVVVFIQGGITIGSSDFGRVWPSGDSTKIDLEKLQKDSRQP
jgi:hypothetical protein